MNPAIRIKRIISHRVYLFFNPDCGLIKPVFNAANAINSHGNPVLRLARITVRYEFNNSVISVPFRMFKSFTLCAGHFQWKLNSFCKLLDPVRSSEWSSRLIVPVVFLITGKKLKGNPEIFTPF